MLPAAVLIGLSILVTDPAQWQLPPPHLVREVELMVPHEHHGSGIIGGRSIVLLLEVAQEVLLALQGNMR